MKVVRVSDIYNVTQISRMNNEAWEKLINFMETQDSDEEVLFDFKDIFLEQPWANDVFRKFISDERVHMKIYSSEETKQHIDLLCEFGYIKPGRVINEDEIIYTPTPKPQKNVMLEGLKNRFLQNIKVENGVGVLNVQDVVDQIGSPNTVKMIEAAIEQFCNDDGINRVRLDTDYMFIQVNILELLAKMIDTFDTKGIKVEISSKDKDIENKIKTYQCISESKKLSPREKVKIFSRFVSKGTVGLLSRFEDTRKLDEFGRKGEGKPILCRVAIFRGIDEGLNFYFRTFNGNYFYTRLHYSLDNDGEELRGLKYEDIKVPIQQLGFSNKFIGSLYHFNFPVQLRLEDYVSTYAVDDDGEIIQVKVTMPKYIQMVLKDFNIKHNVEALEEAIVETDRYLEGLKGSAANR